MGAKASYIIEEGSTVTVRPDSTLTVRAWMGIEGSLRVMETATLSNFSSVQVRTTGSLTVVSGGNYTGSGYLSGTLEQISGIDGALVSFVTTVATDAELREAVAVTGYGSVEIAHGEDGSSTNPELTLDGDLSIPSNVAVNIGNGCSLVIPDGVTLVNEGYISVYGNSTLWIQEGGTLNNLGSLQVYEDGIIIEDGVLLGYGPNQSSNSYDVENLDQLKAAIDAISTSQEWVFINICGDTAITENITFSRGASFSILDGCTLTVCSGNTLTVKAWTGIMGNLLVEENAVLINQNAIQAQGNGTLTVAPGGSYNGADGYLSGTLEQIFGIDAAQIHYTPDVSTEAELREALSATGFRSVNVGVLPGATITLSENLTIPKRATLNFSGNAFLVVP